MQRPLFGIRDKNQNCLNHRFLIQITVYNISTTPWLTIISKSLTMEHHGVKTIPQL